MTDPSYTLIHDLLADYTITSIQPVSESRHHAVWKVSTSSGQVFAVKHHLFALFTRGTPFDLLAVEQKVSALLHAHGAPVAPVMTTAPDHGMSVTTWRGDWTLDDYCQTSDVGQVAERVIDALRVLETAFQKHARELAPHIAPGCQAEDLKADWLEATLPVAHALPDLVAHLTSRQAPPGLSRDWIALIHFLADIPPSIGSTDYNARNIVLNNTGEPCVLELAKIGFDWPERRLVQYTTSLGATRPEGRVVGLLTPSVASSYARQAALVHHRQASVLQAALDGHHLVYCILAALVCCNADSEHPWKNIETRLEDILAQVRTALFNVPQTRAIRAVFQ